MARELLGYSTNRSRHNFGKILLLIVLFYFEIQRDFNWKGVAWPAMHHLSSQWIPPNERSKFLSSYQGSSIGVAIFYPLFGFFINTWSWELIFYFTGIFGSVWYAAWLYFVYDSPAKHPRIDPTERIYIESSLSNSVHSGKVFRMFSIEILNFKALVELVQ